MSSRRRSRSWRATFAVLATAALTLSAAGVALADDVSVDNDTVAPGNQHAISLTVAPGAPVSTSAQMVVHNQGSKNLAAGTPIVVGLDASTTDFDGVTGVTVGNASGTVPTPWTSASPDFTLTSAISFDAPAAPGVYNMVIKYVPTAFTCEDGEKKCLSSGSGDPFNINLTVQSPTSTNHAPSVEFTDAPTAANEGDEKTFEFSIADLDGSDTHSFASGYPDCGTGNVLVGIPSIDQSTHIGTFDCRFVDGLEPAVANIVKVRVTDGAATSAEATTEVVVSNLAPEVEAPSFAVTSVDCLATVTLAGISFTDAGVNDADWIVDIDWGDGSAHTVRSHVTDMDDQPDATHAYTTGGTFEATVTVTDKDTGSDFAKSSNKVVVNQYKTTFLPPFDGSTPSKLIPNSMKNGRTVPVKATIQDLCTGGYVTAPSVVTVGVKKTTVSGTPTADAVEAYADAGASSGNSNLARWNADATSPTGGFWIYNLDSKALSLVTNTYYRVDLYVGGVQATSTVWGVLLPTK